MKRLFLYVLLVVFFMECKVQKTTNVVVKQQQKHTIDRPKLIVGIVVDQMRYDYLIRFYSKYGEKGFKRLLNQGFNCENTHYNYIPTHTAVGHTSIYTGTTPSMHGIISNNWYDKYKKKTIYCVDDANYKTVGANLETSGGGKTSPNRLQVTTITDQLKLAQINKGKVIGISIKDRAAMLPVGYSANAAYWFKGKKEAKFISSSYYIDALPKWVQDFNASGVAKSYLKPWNTLYNINTYTESIADNNNFEIEFKGEKTPTFPHNFPKLMQKNGNYDLLKTSPFGNTLLVDFAKATIKGEQLGKNDATDFLAMSFSSTDYIGHRFGANSKEIEDTYIRLDKEIERFLNFLDTEVGKQNYTLFLTADHAVIPVPSYLKKQKIKAGYFDMKSFKKYVNTITKTHFSSEELVENISNFQIFLNKEKIKSLKLSVSDVSKVIAEEIISFKGVYKTVTAQTLQQTNFTEGILHALQNGYNQKISGDILIVPSPATVYYKHKGSTHGSGYSYDTHVPLIFYGKGIKQGSTKRYIPIIDIAPTMANLLKIESPNACTGKIILEVLE